MRLHCLENFHHDSIFWIMRTFNSSFDVLDCVDSFHNGCVWPFCKMSALHLCF